jgi:hypothetical protein
MCGPGRQAVLSGLEVGGHRRPVVRTVSTGCVALGAKQLVAKFDRDRSIPPRSTAFPALPISETSDAIERNLATELRRSTLSRIFTPPISSRGSRWPASVSMLPRRRWRGTNGPLPSDGVYVQEAPRLSDRADTLRAIEQGPHSREGRGGGRAAWRQRLRQRRGRRQSSRSDW